tara:strand:- start:73 stop:531 length:459 start_codon:yes stop_codon:yes gene_type:complete
MIKKLASYLIIGIFISSCSTPKAVDIIQANDIVMSCNELRLAFKKADLNEDEAHANKGVTNENILSGLFFFPAYFVTYGSSIHAQYNASERKEHLLKLYTKKGCAQPKGDNYQKQVSETLTKLEDIKIKYNQGIIDEENYFEMRRKLLVNFE